MKKNRANNSCAIEILDPSFNEYTTDYRVPSPRNGEPYTYSEGEVREARQHINTSRVNYPELFEMYFSNVEEYALEQ